MGEHIILRRWLSRHPKVLFCYRQIQKLCHLLPRYPGIVANYYAFKRHYQRDFRGKFIFVLPYTGIGPAAQAAELFFRQCQIRRIDPLRDVVVVTRQNFVNPYMLELIQRHVEVRLDDTTVDEIERGGDRFLQNHGLGLFLKFRNGDMFYTESKPSLCFTDDEIVAGYALLSRLGITRDMVWVALHNKDSFYYDKVLGENKSWDSYRDTDFEALRPAIEFLKEQGVQVIRSGHYEASPAHAALYHSLNLFSEKEQAFLAMFIQKHALFSVNGLSGLANVPHLFGTPCLCHNAVPLGEPPVIQRGIVIPKLLRHTLSGRVLPLSEMCKIFTYQGYPEGSWYPVRKVSSDAFQASHLYKKYDLEVIDNTPEELLKGVAEMLQYVQGSLKLSPAQSHAQERFRLTFPLGHPMRHFGGVVSPSFLESHAEFLDLT